MQLLIPIFFSLNPCSSGSYNDKFIKDILKYYTIFFLGTPTNALEHVFYNYGNGVYKVDT